MRDAHRTLIPAILALLLLTSSFVTLATPTSAWAEPRGDGDPVELTPADVKWHNLKSQNNLWFTRPDDSTQAEPGQMVTDRPSRVTFIPEVYRVCETSTGCVEDSTAKAQFHTKPFEKSFSIKGVNALGANIFVEAPPQLKWTIQVFHDRADVSSDRKVAELRNFVPDTTHDPRQGYRANISITETIPWFNANLQPDNQLRVEEGDRLRIEIFAVEGENFQAPAGGSLGDDLDDAVSPDRVTWVLKREGSGEANASYMELFAEDAIRAAAWIEDFDGQVTDVLRNHTDDEKDVIDARFVVESAFGVKDLRDIKPFFYLKRNATGSSENVELAPGEPQVKMTRDASLSGDARRGWSLPDGYWDYSTAKSGEYSAFFGADTFRKGGSGPVNGLGLQWDFIYSDQNIALDLFEGDTDSHSVLPNGSTTYLVEINNTGGNRDTFDLSLSSSALSQGWRSEIKGANLLAGDRIRLNANESSLLRVTVHAPSDAALGASRLFTLNATSNLDTTVSEELDLLATVDDERTNEVGIIRGEAAIDTLIRPRDNATVTLYAWNKGTVPTDILVQMREGTDDPLWNVSLRSHGRATDSFTASSVPPGDIQTVTVHFRTFGAQAADDHSAFVNVTYPGAGSNFEAPLREVTAQVELTEGVRVEILNSIDASNLRYMEMECSDENACPDNSGNPSGPLNVGSSDDDVDKDEDDGLDAAYFRVWVTNTGDTTDNFLLNIPDSSIQERTVLEVDANRCPKAFFDDVKFNSAEPDPDNPDEAQCDQNAETLEIGPEIVQINPRTGEEPGINTIRNLGPDETAEVYVKVPHRNDAVYFAPTTFDFRVEARAENSQAFSSAGVHVEGNNGVESQSALLLEAVSRGDLDEYADFSTESDTGKRPLVDITNAREDAVVKEVAVASSDERAHATYRVRLTNGATYADGGGGDPAEVTVGLTGIKEQDGWRAKLVPAHEFAGDATQWHDTHTFDNCRDVNQDGDCDGSDEHVGYMDEEYVVRVWLPEVKDDQKPLAGESNSIVVTASGTGEFAGDDQLILETQILDMPRLTLEPVSTEEFVQPGGTTAFLVNLNNSGGARGTFHLQAKAPTGWNVVPAHQNYTISAYKEQPVAVLVTAPNTAQPGQEADIEIQASWDDPRDTKADDGKQDRIATFLNVTASVVEEGDLEVSATDGTTRITSPGGSEVSFPFDVTNTAQSSTDVRLEAQGTGDWTVLLGKDSFESTSEDPDGDLASGETQSTSLVVRAPNDVVEGTSHSFIVKAYEVGNEQNFAVETFTVSINEGVGRPVLKVDKVEELVERGSHTRFTVDVQNRGTAQDTFPLVLNEPSTTGWNAHVEDENGVVIDDLTLAPNTRERVYINVSAPFEESDGTTVDTRLTVYNSNFEHQSQAALTAVLQDYAVGLDVGNERVDFIPGVNKRIKIDITNRGNGNDTLNVSMDLQGLEGAWSVTFNRDRFFLEPGETEEAIATLKSPRSPLPTPRTFTFRVWAGTDRGAVVDEWDNRTQAIVVNVLPYRSQDVDQDGFLELAVDHNKDRRDGFELYREIFREGRNSTFLQALDGDEDRSVDHLLDDPRDGGLDGVADVYWDPDDVVVYDIRWTPDIDEDGSPDYLLDTDGDDVVDAFWNPVLRILGDAESRRIVGDDQRQFLLDTDGDGVLDTYHDPVRDITTSILSAPGQGKDALGIDTDDNGRADKYYNTRTEEVSDAQVANLSRFAQQYWYLFVLLGAVVVVFGVVLYRRQDTDSPGEGEPPEDE